MVNVENLNNLICEIPEIESCFTKESHVFATTYSFKTHRKEEHPTMTDIIYNNPKFVEWKAKMEYELGQLKQDQLISEILKLFNHFTGWTDKSTFRQLKTKLLVLSEHLEEYRDVTSELPMISDLRIPERELAEKMLGALCNLQKNTHYSATDKEDTMNDYVRDMLSASYEVKDQTRQGESVSGNEAGEVDIQICYSSLPVVMIEGIKLDSLKKTELDAHINKLLTKYDPNGCPYAMIIIYATCSRFDQFCENLYEYLNAYAYPYDRKTELLRKDISYSEIKLYQIVLDRNNQHTLVSFYAVHKR